MGQRVRTSITAGRPTGFAWLIALAIVVGFLVLPFAAYGGNGPPDHATGQPDGGPTLSPPAGPPVSPPAGPPPGKPFGPPVSPPVGPPLSPPVGPALSPPVGPPLNPPAGPPDHWFDFEQPLNEHWFGCREIVLIQGIERVKSDTRTGPSDNELFRFTIVWDAVGIGQSTGNQYEVSFREQLVAVGWPPLTPPTSNIVSYGATLALRSEDSNQRYRVISHRVIHWDDELGEATLTGTFVKDWERCK